MIELNLYNTLQRQLSIFQPIDPKNVRIYACGPTVYDFIHIGNARPLVVFDVLVRLLRIIYPKVTYVRNITDIDDKINKRAIEKKINISELTDETIKNFHKDSYTLGNLKPDFEPKATEHISEMIEMIETLISNGLLIIHQGMFCFLLKNIKIMVLCQEGHLRR